MEEPFEGGSHLIPRVPPRPLIVLVKSAIYLGKGDVNRKAKPMRSDGRTGLAPQRGDPGIQVHDRVSHCHETAPDEESSL